jgi:hypothetical protein
MCSVSMVGDYWRQNDFPKFQEVYNHNLDYGRLTNLEAQVADLRKNMEELKKLLAAAKQYDEATGQHECHHEDKVRLIKEMAKIAGVDLGDLV